MTISKASRLIHDLIDKYGDIEIGTCYDYWLTYCYKDDGVNHYRSSEVIVVTLHLSDVIGTQIGWSELKNFEAICQGKRKPASHPVEVQASKELYHSIEQQQLRKKHRGGLTSMMSYLGAGYNFEMQKYYDLHRNIMFAESTSPKKFGMALDNIKKH